MAVYDSGPLWRAVSEYLSKGPLRAHMPGHAGKPGVFPESLSAVFPLDLTEVPGLDSLYDAEDCIAESEALASEIFGAGATLYSAGGSTLCIQAMLAAGVGPGRKFLAARNLHRSAAAACALLDLEPVFFAPDPETGAVDVGAVEALADRHPDAAAVYVTCPDYLGRLFDPAPLAELCRRRGLRLLTDAAHGAHLPFVAPEYDPLRRGAFAVARSAHKTLPALTPGAFLQFREAEPKRQAEKAMALFGSTSPSYPVLLSLESACLYLKHEGLRAFARLRDETEKLRNAAEAAGLCPLRENIDPVRLTLRPFENGRTGRDLARFLQNRGIVCEYADDLYTVLILSPLLADADFARLRAALAAAADLPKSEKLPRSVFAADFPLPRPAVGVREAVFAESETVRLDAALGRVAAEPACPCPPGVPLVFPGEKIDRSTLFLLKAYGVSDVKVIK